jgi:hypothetical protein
LCPPSPIGLGSPAASDGMFVVPGTRQVGTCRQKFCVPLLGEQF